MGNKKGHKGKRRHFTNPHELEYKREKEEKEKEWRRKRGEIVESDEEDEEEEEEEEEEDVESQEEDKSDKEEPLIEISNPNRMPQKDKKVASIDDGVILSRRDKEQIIKEKAREKYNKLHAEGKTKQAQEDLARLALIRHKREEAAKKRLLSKPKTTSEPNDSKPSKK